MADIIIQTDGSLEGTKLKVDGKDVTDKENVIGIYFSSSAAYRSRYSEGVIGGYSSVSYETIDKDGKTQHISYGTTEQKFTSPIGKISMNDSITNYIGQEIDNTKKELIDKIIDHCTENNIPCPPREKLVTRSEGSLRDKIEDLGA